MPSLTDPDWCDPADDDPAPDGETHTRTIPADVAGQRLDRAVVAVLPHLSRSFVQALLADGRVLLNGSAARASHPVRAGDSLYVHVPPPQPTDLVPEALPLDIVYEDDAIVVVNKAAGMVVHPAPGHPSGTLVNALLARYPTMTAGNALRPGIVHRLDQGTSGLLVVARTDAALHALTAQQQARQMHKQYQAVVVGRMRPPDGTIDAPIGRHRSDRLRMAVVADGKPARTHYRTREDLAGYALLDVWLETGRTHQIRVHCAHRQRPILGDPVYGGRAKRAPFGMRRQFLHAARLGFAHPTTGAWCEFHAPLPPDLAAVLTKLRRAAGVPSGA